MQHPFLSGNLIYLRGLEERDLNGEYFQWFNDQENDVYTSHALWPNTDEKMREFFDRVVQYKNDLVLAIIEKASDSHIGNVALHGINWVHRTAELAIIIGQKDMQSKGYGTEATNLIVKYAFEKLNIHRIGLGVNEHNKPAIKAYDKAGFLNEGRFKDHFLRNGKFSDTIRMAIINKEA